MAAVVAPRLSERFVAWIWQRQLLRGPLVCTDGRAVQVIFPGRSWGEGQPDFQGALIAWPDGRIERGDVEIHVSPKDWKQHGHQGDPAYRQVVLHVVLNADSSGPTLNVLGDRVPTLLLGPHLARPIETLQIEFECDHALAVTPCQTDPAAIVVMLERAGIQRFSARADRLEGDLSVILPSELLWRGVARALGYTRNADAMTHLAERMPFNDICSLLEVDKPAEPEVAVFGALLGAAGLLPSQRNIAPHGLFAEAVERAWDRAQAFGWRAVDDGPAWETRRVRPGNHPVRRLGALAVLAVAFNRSAPLTELARIVLEDSHPGRALVRYFELSIPGREWASLLDLEHSLVPPVSGLIGRDRAAEIAINAALPLLYALGRFWENRALEDASLEAYRTFPRIASNGLVRGMAQQIAGADGLRLANTACRQQGLLHIFRTTCREHACEGCPAKGQELGVRGQER